MLELFDYLSYACAYFVLFVTLKFLWGNRKVIRNACITAKRDVSFVFLSIFILLPTWIWRFLTNKTVSKGFDGLCASAINRSRVCFFYEDEKWTFGQVQSMSFQVANYFQNLGYRRGDVIGLAMQNRPEVICIWLGLSRIGVTTALINYQLQGESLEHCVNASKCKSVIFGSELREVFNEIWKGRLQNEKPQTDVILYELDRYLDVFKPTFCSSKQNGRKEHLKETCSANNNVKSPINFSTYDFAPNDFAACLRNTSSRPTVISRRDQQPDFFDSCLYIFTSGTTGMPKTAHCSHSRLTMLGMGSGIMLKLDPSKDIAYCPLPLYHTFALAGVHWTLLQNVPLVIIPKFSASNFWKDVHRYNVTACLYMGELCRFIVNQPPNPDGEKNHTLQKMFGCGIKPEVWETFKERFSIGTFMESYGSTEGNCTLVNMEATKIGAVGYIPPWMWPFYSLRLIKVDETTGEILRDKETGFAISCKEDEPGELVGKIVNFFPSLRYDGYTSKEANEKKIARNVFRKGDSYFRSGDIMVRDEFNYFYFKDRIGDSYRWKSENVSTAEVEGLILRLADMKTTVVYGVKIPGTEGRAGMAAIADPEGTLDLKRLGEGLEKGLPIYARPVFIRLVRGDNDLDMTGTFKLKKFNLQKEGFDIAQIPDPIFVYNPSQHAYQKLEMGTYKQIMQGNYRL